jgi:hypothetical protein
MVSSLVENRLRSLVYNDVKAMGPRSSQTSGIRDPTSPLLTRGSSGPSAFSEIGLDEELLTPGEWSLDQVASLCAEDTGPAFFYEPVYSGAIEEYTMGRNDCYDGETRWTAALGTMRTPRQAKMPDYFQEYQDRLCAAVGYIGDTYRAENYTLDSFIQ